MKITPFLPPEHVGLELIDAIPRASWVLLRADLERRGFTPTGTSYPGGYRDNDRLVFDDPELAARWFAHLGAALPGELVVDGERWNLVGFNPRFRACRYRDGQAFCIHRDGAHVPDADTRSLLTLQLYLDDAEAMAGGRTRFYADREGRERWAAISPRAGTAIVFEHRVWHDGEAVTSGEKQVLRTDVMYRRARAAPVLADPRELGRHRGYAWRAIACRDGAIASCGRDGTVRRWRGRQLIGELDLAAGSVTALVEASDGRLWCGTRSGLLAVIEPPGSAETGAGVVDRPVIRGEPVGLTPAVAARVVATELGAVLSAAALPAGGVVISTSRGELVELHGDQVRRRRQAHAGWAWAVAWRAGVVSCGDDGRVVEDGRELAALGCPARALAVLPDGSLLVGTSDGAVQWLRGDDVLRWQAHDAAITSLAVASGGAWASGSEDGSIKLWRGAQLLRAWPARADVVTSVAFANHDRGGHALISTGYDGAVWSEPVVLPGDGQQPGIMENDDRHQENADSHDVPAWA